MAKVRICKRCGGPVEPNHVSANYCDKCRTEMHLEAWDRLKEKRQQAYLDSLKREQAAKVEADRRKYKGPSLKEINDAAKAHGMTYGQYVSKYGSVII